MESPQHQQSTNPPLLIASVKANYSLDEVRNIVLEMHNEAVAGLNGRQRWDMQKRLGAIRDKWKLGY